MIKLTTTQAKAVATKIRQRIMNIQENKREKIKKEYVLTDEYKVKQNEVHEACITVAQTAIKLGTKMGISISYYCSYDLGNEKDVETAEKAIMSKILNDYVSEVYNAPNVPSEDELVTDLIFESLTSEGIEQLMDKFIEPYL